MVEYWSPKPNVIGSNPFFPVGVWPSGKALVFGTSIKGSNPFIPFFKILLLLEKVTEWFMVADCKSVEIFIVGSNPTPLITHYKSIYNTFNDKIKYFQIFAFNFV